MSLSAYEINKLFHAISVNEEVKQRYVQDRVTVMEEYNLNEQEQKMIQNNDFATLTEYGVNGLILMRIKDVHQVPVPEMLKSLRSRD
jgi:putative IMPACT (imprinted ancient) family translation regulator